MESPNCFTAMYRQVDTEEVNQKRKSSQTIINSQDVTNFIWTITLGILDQF